MANVAKGRTGTINSADTYQLFDVGTNGGVWTIQLDATGWTGDIKVVARVKGATTYRQIPYTPLYLNGAVSDGVAVNTTMTTSSLIQVIISDGLELALDCTAFTGGTMAYNAFPAASA